MLRDMHSPTMWALAALTLILGSWSGLAAQTPALGDDPIFDLKAITTDALDAKTLKTTPDEKENLVIEEIEFTSEMHEGKPVRIFGIMAYPKGGTKLPLILWCQGGMAPAGDYFPRVFAKKGYMCLNITLPHGDWNPWAAFDAKNPKDGNLTHFAHAQMRAITYMTQRPEADATRIGVSGSSYGSFFSTLVAGADPRVSAGMGFFAGGHHELGTNLPQFTGLASVEEVEVWKKTIDPAWRLKNKKVAFLWGVASNDHWFHFPAVVKTFEETAGTDKRISIVPHWAHGFPETIDNMLVDWFDTNLLKTRKPYNAPQALQVKAVDGRLHAQWAWSGDNAVKKAELVVSYGSTMPWHGWVNRAFLVLPAKIEGSTASVEIPVPEVKTDILLFGNITDEKDVLMSTLPVTINPAALGLAKPTSQAAFNCFPLGDLSVADLDFLARHGEAMPAKPDTANKQAGEQSVKMEAPKDPKQQTALTFKLLNVPQHSHTLKLWLKADKDATVQVTVQGVPPQNWAMGNKPTVVDPLRKAFEKKPQPYPYLAEAKPPVFTLNAPVGTAWKQYTLEVPYKDDQWVEGYQLRIVQATEGTAAYWVDSISLEPQWSH